MEKIKTATGREFDCSSLSTLPTPARAYIRIKGETVATLAVVFSDPKETVHLECGPNRVEGYTKLFAIFPEPEAIRIVLTKE